MKILQIIQKPELRGAEIFACQLSEELIKLGHQVDVVYLFENKTFDLSFNLSFIPLNATQHKRFFDFKAYKHLHKIIVSGGYDVVQANASDTLKYAAISKMIWGWKAPLIFRNASKMGSFVRNRLHRALNQYFLSKCAYFISVSENCRKDLIALYNKASYRSKTIPIGTYLFDSVPCFSTPATAPVFINVGSFVSEKNHKFLLTVFNAYLKKHAQGYLWLVGDGKLRSVVEQQAIDLGIQDQVRFWGYRKDVISIIKSSTVMVMPSIVEGLPGVILEALSGGIPVIASAVGGIPEVIHHDVNGFCLDEESIPAYLKCMERLTDDILLRKKFIDAGRELVLSEYLMPYIAERFLQEYKALSMKDK